MPGAPPGAGDDAGAAGKTTLEFYEDEHGDQPVLRWLREELSPTQRRASVAMRELVEELGIGVCDTEFGRQLGGGLFEFRLRQDAEESSGGWGKSLDTLSRRESASSFGSSATPMASG